jgi:hypothetical protein
MAAGGPGGEAHRHGDERRPHRHRRPALQGFNHLLGESGVSFFAGEGKYDVSRRIKRREAEREPRLLAG